MTIKSGHTWYQIGQIHIYLDIHNSAILTFTSMWEWDGEKTKYVAVVSVKRKIYTFLVFNQSQSSICSVLLKDLQSDEVEV